MRPLLLSVGLVVCPRLGASQQPVPGTLALFHAISLAPRHNPAARPTLHDRSPAAWGVRSARSSAWLPTRTAPGGVACPGPVEQNVLASSVAQTTT